MKDTQTLAAPSASAPDEESRSTWQQLLFARLRALSKTYTFRVLVQGILTLYVVTTFTFFLVRRLPGDPVQIRIDQLMQQQNLSLEDATRMARGQFAYDPDAPELEQFIEYMGNLHQGDLGQSISTSSGTDVSSLLARYLPWTLFSVGLALFLSFFIGVFVGLAMAYWRGGIFDNIFTALASILYGIPDYVIALLLLMVAGVQLELFKIGDVRGGIDPNLEPGFTSEYITSLFQHTALPVFTYVSASIGGWILTMKSSTISVLGEDYITVAKARGLPEHRILTMYVGRNAILPLVTRLAISLGFVVSGSVIIEELFLYPGLGRNLFLAIGRRDYPVMQGIFLVIAFTVVFSNILSDLLMGVLDPRVRLGESK